MVLLKSPFSGDFLNENGDILKAIFIIKAFNR